MDRRSCYKPVPSGHHIRIHPRHHPTKNQPTTRIHNDRHALLRGEYPILEVHSRQQHGISLDDKLPFEFTVSDPKSALPTSHQQLLSLPLNRDNLLPQKEIRFLKDTHTIPLHSKDTDKAVLAGHGQHLLGVVQFCVPDLAAEFEGTCLVEGCGRGFAEGWGGEHWKVAGKAAVETALG